MAVETIQELLKLIQNLNSSASISKQEALSIVSAKVSELQQQNFETTVSEEFQNDFVSGILDRIPDPVFIKDENHKWVLLNDACCKMFGFEKDYLLGKSDYDFFPKDEADEYWKVDNLVFTQGTEILNEEFQTNPVTGEKQVLSTKKTLYTDFLGKKYIVGVIRDFTLLKQAEADLKAITASKEKLFSILAHDIKEPFNSLIGFSGLLSKNYFNYNDEKRLKFINIIDKANRENLLFIENILAWSAGQMGKIENNPEILQLNSIIEQSVEIFASPILFKSINLVVEKKAENPMVMADKYMLKTIIRNLLSNAVKFTPKAGKIEIKYEYTDDQNIILKVKDSGSGMTKEQIDNLNNKTFTSSPGTEGETGIGLGLKLCQEFAIKCGCHLSFTSAFGKGTEFSILLKTDV